MSHLDDVFSSPPVHPHPNFCPASPIDPEYDDDDIFPIIDPLHDKLSGAIENGSAESVIDELVKARLRLYPNAMYHEAIMRAIARGRLDLMRLFADHGIRVGEQALGTAARTGHIPVLEYLMEYFSWPIDRISDWGWTLLTRAAEHRDTVAWLLSRGANKDLQDPNSETALCRAIAKQSKDVIRMLLDAGADVTKGAPLQAALLAGEEKTDLGLMRELLDRGAPVDKFFGESSYFYEGPFFEQTNALHSACLSSSHRNLAAARLLLAYGADPHVNQRIYTGDLPHTSALAGARARGYTDMVAAIEEHLRKIDQPSKS